MVKKRFADVVFPAELGWVFLAVDDLLDEFEFEFWSVCFAAHDFSFGEGIPRSFKRGYWSQVKVHRCFCCSSFILRAAHAFSTKQNQNAQILAA
jgi:hypothetical protein